MKRIALYLDHAAVAVFCEHTAASRAFAAPPDYARIGYRQRIDAHIAGLREKSKAAGLDYFLLDTSRPLDEALREYLSLRAGRL